MPPKKSRTTKRGPAPPASPAPPVPTEPPAPTSIPPPVSSENPGPVATVDGTNTPAEPIPISAPEAPASTTTLPLPSPPPPPPPSSNTVPIPVGSTIAPGPGGRRRGRKRKADTAAAGAEASGTTKTTKKTKKSAESSSIDASAGIDITGKGVDDISDIHLPGEEEDKVPVYDTCDEVRKKLTAYLRREGVTQAAFLRALHAELREKKKTSRLQSSQLARFLQMKGANTGNTSAIFYAAYVYFEKLRVKQGKPKSKHREDMERIWKAKGGFDIDTPSSRGYFCGPGEYPSIDQYGRLLINGKICH